MANLIEYIQSQVYENSTEDISGSIMQQVLTRMASDEGVVNVHTVSGQTPFADYNNAQAARDAVPDGIKKLGLIITYKLSSGWYIDEFIGSATSGWSTASNWKCLGPISVSQNASTGKTTITIGSESYDVATEPVSVSQNSQTGHTDINIGPNSYPVASVEEVGQLRQEINSEKETSQELTNISSGSNYVLLPIDVKAGEQIQVKFNTSRNDVLTRFNINYNDDWSKKIIDANGVDAVTENINKWIDFTAPIDMTYLGYAVWNSSGIDETVTISFRNKSSISFEIEALKENDQALNTKIENINSELGDAVQVSPNLVKGKFITDSGTIATNAGYAYTKPIELKKGDELIVNAAGYGTAVAMISLYSGEIFTPVVISYGTGSIVRDYLYIAENDCNVVCSFSIQLDHIISVRRIAKSPVSYDGIPYVSMFRTLLCIGDSTTAGVVDWRNPSAGADTVPEYSWPTFFNKITGVSIFNYGQSSATCKSWYINHYPNSNMGIPEGVPGREPAEGTVKYDACVIQLGVNDWFKIVSDLGRAPVNAEECASQIAEAKEYLGYLIEYTKVCSTSCKIFLATTSSAFNNRIASFFLSAWKTMLEELAVEYTDVFVVDINTYSKLENEVYFYNHPTALGYAKTAKDLASYISYVMAQNIAQFRNVQFIRTNHSY